MSFSVQLTPPPEVLHTYSWLENCIYTCIVQYMYYAYGSTKPGGPTALICILKEQYCYVEQHCVGNF